MSNPITPTVIKNRNRQLVYHYIRSNGPVSKHDIVADVGLSIPTVTQNLQYLEKNGCITASDIKKSTGGRSASTYIAVNDCRLAIGVFLSANHITVVSVDLSGIVTHSLRERIPFDLGSDSYLKKLADLVETVKTEASISDEQLLGVGIAVPALVSEDGQDIHYGLTLDFSKTTRCEIAKYIPYPNRLFHDSKVAGFAETWVRSDIDNAFYLNLNNNIGGCFILNKEIYQGDYHRAGEVGHMKLDLHSPRQCYCGKYGCFETICTASVLEAYSDGSLEYFFALLEQQDAGAHKIWSEYLDYLALAIHNLHLLFDCSIIIGGYVGSYISPYIEELCTRVDDKTFFHENAIDYVFPCKYKIESTAAGAAICYINEFIDNI